MERVGGGHEEEIQGFQDQGNSWYSELSSFLKCLLFQPQIWKQSEAKVK